MSVSNFSRRWPDYLWWLLLVGGGIVGLARWAMQPDSPVQQLKAQGFWYVPIVVVIVFFAGVALGWVLGNIKGWEKARKLGRKIEREMKA